jgi:hypothetical protein
MTSQGFGRRYKNASSHAASARRSSTYSGDPFDVDQISPAELFAAPAAEANTAAGRRKTKQDKALTKLAFSNPGVQAAVAAVAQSPRPSSASILQNTPAPAAGSASNVLARAGKRRLEAAETGSDTSLEDLPPLSARKRVCGPKNKQQATREYVSQQPEFQNLIQHISQEKVQALLDKIGLRFQGQGLEILFADGPFLDFCVMIAKFNGTKSVIVRNSKFKMLQTWANRDNEHYDYVGGQRPQVLTMRDMGNIVLTVKGKHNLLMHIDIEEEDMPHSLENICRDKASDVMTKLFELSRSLPSHLETVNKYLKTRNETQEKSKEQFREQIKIMAERHGVGSMQALRSLQSDAQLLYRGLFPPKKNPDGTTVFRKDGKTPVTHTAAEMVLIANPQMESKKQVYSRSITAFANEPILDATRLQRTAVTARMKQGMDHRAAHKAVGESKGINLALLFGVPEDDVKQLADLSFNKTKGIELFDSTSKREQRMLQIEAGADAGP